MVEAASLEFSRFGHSRTLAILRCADIRPCNGSVADSEQLYAAVRTIDSAADAAGGLKFNWSHIRSL